MIAKRRFASSRQCANAKTVNMQTETVNAQTRNRKREPSMANAKRSMYKCEINDAVRCGGIQPQA
jgi:hypothetical protein